MFMTCPVCGGDTRIIEGDVLLMITSKQSKLKDLKELTDYATS